MRKFNNTVFNSFLCGMFVALFLSAFASVCFADADRDAKMEFENLSTAQIEDPDVLDQFIKKYPNSDQARLAFVLRYSLLTNAPSIEDYNNFINKYSNKDIAPIAIHEVYKLYCDQNRAAGFYDFIARYPGSHQAIVAKERLQQLFFEYVCLLDTEEDYDSFIYLFPEAPQVTAAKQKATIKAIETEQKDFDAFKKSDPSEDEIKKHFYKKAKILETNVRKFLRRHPNTDPSADTSGDDKVAILIQLLKIDCFSAALQEVYPEYDASGRVFNAIQELETIQRMDKIVNSIEKKHKELLAKLDEETDRICSGLEVIHRDLLQLHEDNINIINELRTGFKLLHQDMINVHQELKSINIQLVKVNANLEKIHHDINANFERLDKRLEVINHNLIEVQKAVTDSALATNQLLKNEFDNMNQTIESGFSNQIVALDKLNQNMINGFSETDKRLMGIGQKLDNLDNDMTAGFNSVNQNLNKLDDHMTAGFNKMSTGLNNIQSSLVGIGHKLDNIDSNMQSGFSGLSQQLNVLDNHLVTGLNEVGHKIDNMDNHMRIGMNALNENMNAMRQEMGEGFSSVSSDMREGFNRVCNTVYQATESVNQSLAAIHYDINEVNSNVIAGNQILNDVNSNVIAGNQILNDVNRNVIAGNQILNDVNRNVIEGNQTIRSMHNDMVQGFQNQAKISQAILSQSQMQTSKLEEIKKISYSGFNNLSKKMDSSIALQGSMNTMLKAQWALQQSLPALQGSGANLNSQGSISSLIQSAFGDSDTTKILGNMIDTGLSTGSKTKAVSAGIGTAASLFVGSFCPAAAPIVASVGTKAAEGLIRGVKKVFNLFGGGSVDGFEYYALDDSSSLTASSSDDTSINSSFQETNYRVLFTAYQDADEDDEELREALMKMIFQEDKRRVLYAAVQLASFKRPYPVFPKNLEDLVLDAKNATELREAILPLAVYCGVSPEALTFAAQYIY